MEMIKERNRYVEEIQKNTIKAGAVGVAATATAYGIKKVGEKSLGADEASEMLVSTAAELWDAW